MINFKKSFYVHLCPKRFLKKLKTFLMNVIIAWIIGLGCMSELQDVSIRALAVIRFA
jgi:hypothetical protein